MSHSWLIAHLKIIHAVSASVCMLSMVRYGMSALTKSMKCLFFFNSAIPA